MFVEGNVVCLRRGVSVSHMCCENNQPRVACMANHVVIQCRTGSLLAVVFRAPISLLLGLFFVSSTNGFCCTPSGKPNVQMQCCCLSPCDRLLFMLHVCWSLLLVIRCAFVLNEVIVVRGLGPCFNWLRAWQPVWLPAAMFDCLFDPSCVRQSCTYLRLIRDDSFP